MRKSKSRLPGGRLGGMCAPRIGCRQADMKNKVLVQEYLYYDVQRLISMMSSADLKDDMMGIVLVVLAS